MDATPGPAEALAAGLLVVAAEIEAEEARIKEVLLAAVGRGDLGFIREVLVRWMRGPVCDVLTGLELPERA